ncbi:MAG: MATE family efflux transporter [Trueperaceae bacterium]|nr:MAG: MATE family efflux transporter [Trueperaceae bacterium]
MPTRRFDRDIFSLAWPALLALAADPLVSMVDTAFVGRLGTRELAALGVNTSIFTLMFLAFNFLAYGTTPMIGKAVGGGDWVEAGRIVVQALSLALLVGFVALVSIQLLAVPILTVMGTSDELRPDALSYLRVRALAGPALLLITAGNGAFRGFQDTRTPLWITTVLNLVNLVLDPILIFAFGWGLAGAAWATVIAQWLGAFGFVLFLLVVRRDRYRVTLTLPTFKEFQPLLRVGWELAVRTYSLVLVMTLATAVATRVGVVEVAAHQVASQLWFFLAMVSDSLAIAAQALVARFLGEHRRTEARAVADRLLFVGLVLGVLLAGLFWGLRHVLPQLFTSEPAVLSAVSSLFPLIVLIQPINSSVFVWDGIFMGAGAFGYLARAMLLVALVTSLFLFLVIPLNLGLQGVWWGMVALMLGRAVSLALRYWGVQPLMSVGSER